MHLTPDVSAGTLISLAVTVCGVLVTIGSLVQLIKRLVQDVVGLRADFDTHVASDVVEFTSIRSVLTDIKVAVASKETT